MNMSKSTFYGGCRQELRSFLSLPKLECGPQEINLGHLPTLYIFRKFGITVTKFEKTQIHFKCEVFAEVAVVNAKAP